MLGFYFVIAYIVVAFIGFYFVVKSGPKKRTPYKPNYKTTFTVPESGTYKISVGDSIRVSYPSTKDKVFYKPNTNQIIDGNDLVLLGDL